MFVFPFFVKSFLSLIQLLDACQHRKSIQKLTRFYL